jgi:prolyl-tRNA synthetase
MRYSQLFGKTSKSIPSDAESINAKLLTQAGFINKEMSGIYNFLPLGFRVLRKIQEIVREEMNLLGGQEILMPVLSSIENWQKTRRDQEWVDVLYRLDNMVLNPTHEEIVTPLVQKYTFSYRDLPVAVYQIQEKFRNEPRAKSGLLRGREFNMKDLYSFHKNEGDLNDFYQNAIKAYQNVFNRLGLGKLTYLTYASGGSFSKYSHEFQTECVTGEDTIFVCDRCHTAVNREIIDEQVICPDCNSDKLRETKAIEIGNIFKLGTKFTDAFGFSYVDEKGAVKPILMSCFGLGPSRVMGTLVEVFHDENGIIWPQSVAPFQIHLIGLNPEAFGIYEQLRKLNLDVLFDDRDDVSAGVKFATADLIGIPIRIVVSPRSLENGGVEIKNRNSQETSIIPINKLDSAILNYGKAR